MNDLSIPTVYADFNNLDQSGFLRLNTAGTRDDLLRLQLELEVGLELHFTDGELSVEGNVCEPGTEGVWRAQIDKSAIRELRPDE
tara:strand:- start:174 stop:428 length:255 start_codon:yes stop_codon:yes gene_type:complete